MAGTPLWGEGIVQPTNPKGAAKAVVGSITVWSQVRILPGPLQLKAPEATAPGARRYQILRSPRSE